MEHELENQVAVDGNAVEMENGQAEQEDYAAEANAHSPGDAGEYQANEDNENFEDIDLTPYEEDDDQTLHQKLVAAKLARKRAEDDLRLLTNRIQLLK